jgi:hypothetical protein
MGCFVNEPAKTYTVAYSRLNHEQKHFVTPKFNYQNLKYDLVNFRWIIRQLIILAFYIFAAGGSCPKGRIPMKRVDIIKFR